jgi:hypothetical protein
MASKEIKGMGRFVLASALVVAATGAAMAQTAPLAKERTVTVNGKSYLLKSRLKSILIGSFTYGYTHSIGAPNLESTLKRIGTAEGWTVDVTTKGDDVTAAKLGGYQVFFANFIGNFAQSGSFKGEKAVQDFVEVGGNGAFVMHSTGDSRQSTNWPWFYSTLHPCIYTGESSRTDVTAPIFVPAAMKIHPVMEGISFNGKDTTVVEQGEFHTFQKLINTVRPDAEILMRMDGTKCASTSKNAKSNCGLPYTNYSTPGGYPIAWSFKATKGTVGYFMEGHDLFTMQAMTQAVWDKFFKQFMYYMAGYDSTVVPTNAVHKEGSIPQAINKSGITFHDGEDAGVLITRAGNHLVSLYDMTGKQLYQDHGTQVPMDYDVNEKLHGVRPGIYVMRVAVPGAVQSKRIFIR